MVILIAGETHTGKTLLAQKLLEAYRYPCLSLDHLKMGLIRSGQCALSPESDGAELTRYLWPIVSATIRALTTLIGATSESTSETMSLLAVSR